MNLKDKHEHFMNEALKEARIAFEEDEVPIGAIVVLKDRIIARGHNQVERLNDVTAHAEMIAITSAANSLGSKYLEECAMYVTIEPCMMCATALFWSRIPTVYFGAADVKFGFSKFNTKIFPSKVKVHGGLMEDECRLLMQDFFNAKRDS